MFLRSEEQRKPVPQGRGGHGCPERSRGREEREAFDAMLPAAV